MEIRVKEKSLREVEEKLNSMTNDLSKISYMESALKENVTFDVKRFLYDKLAEIFSQRKMYDRAALAISNKITITTTFREKMETYVHAGELFAKAGRVVDAEHMFNKALGEANTIEKEKIKQKVREVFFKNAEHLERAGKRASAVVFYERLLGMGLDEKERNSIKEKILLIYKALGEFSKARTLEGKT
jgi:tetratricopeptide (TPR) repeat protein